MFTNPSHEDLIDKKDMPAQKTQNSKVESPTSSEKLLDITEKSSESSYTDEQASQNFDNQLFDPNQSDKSYSETHSGRKLEKHPSESRRIKKKPKVDESEARTSGDKRLHELRKSRESEREGLAKGTIRDLIAKFEKGSQQGQRTKSQPPNLEMRESVKDLIKKFEASKSKADSREKERFHSEERKSTGGLVSEMIQKFQRDIDARNAAKQEEERVICKKSEISDERRKDNLVNEDSPLSEGQESGTESKSAGDIEGESPMNVAENPFPIISIEQQKESSELFKNEVRETADFAPLIQREQHQDIGEQTQHTHNPFGVIQSREADVGRRLSGNFGVQGEDTEANNQEKIQHEKENDFNQIESTIKERNQVEEGFFKESSNIAAKYQTPEKKAEDKGLNKVETEKLKVSPMSTTPLNTAKIMSRSCEEDSQERRSFEGSNIFQHIDRILQNASLNDDVDEAEREIVQDVDEEQKGHDFHDQIKPNEEVSLGQKFFGDGKTQPSKIPSNESPAIEQPSFATKTLEGKSAINEEAEGQGHQLRQEEIEFINKILDLSAIQHRAETEGERSNLLKGENLKHELLSRASGSNEQIEIQPQKHLMQQQFADREVQARESEERTSVQRGSLRDFKIQRLEGVQFEPEPIPKQGLESPQEIQSKRESGAETEPMQFKITETIPTKETATRNDGTSQWTPSNYKRSTRSKEKRTELYASPKDPIILRPHEPHKPQQHGLMFVNKEKTSNMVTAGDQAKKFVENFLYSNYKKGEIFSMERLSTTLNLGRHSLASLPPRPSKTEFEQFEPRGTESGTITFKGSFVSAGREEPFRDTLSLSSRPQASQHETKLLDNTNQLGKGSRLDETANYHELSIQEGVLPKCVPVATLTAGSLKPTKFGYKLREEVFYRPIEERKINNDVFCMNCEEFILIDQVDKHSLDCAKRLEEDIHQGRKRIFVAPETYQTESTSSIQDLNQKIDKIISKLYDSLNNLAPEKRRYKFIDSCKRLSKIAREILSEDFNLQFVLSKLREFDKIFELLASDANDQEIGAIIYLQRMFATLQHKAKLIQDKNCSVSKLQEDMQVYEEIQVYQRESIRRKAEEELWKYQSDILQEIQRNTKYLRDELKGDVEVLSQIDSAIEPRAEESEYTARTTESEALMRTRECLPEDEPLRKYFYAEAINIKLSLPKTHLGRELPISELYDQCIRLMLPKEEYVNFIKKRFNLV